MGLNSFKISDFRGGIWKPFPHSIIDPVEVPNGSLVDLRNLELGPHGKFLYQRAGIMQFQAESWNSGTAPSTNGVQHGILAKTSPVSSAGVWVYSDQVGRIHEYDTSAFTPDVFTPAATGASHSFWEFIVAQTSANANKVFGGNGSNAAFHSDLTTYTTWNPISGFIPKALAVWKNRMCIANGADTTNRERIYVGPIGDPTGTWDTNSFVDIREGDQAEPIMGLLAYRDYLIVFKTHSVWKVYDQTGFRNSKIADVGLWKAGAFCVFEDMIYWFGPGGFYKSDGNTYSYETGHCKEVWRNVTQDSYPQDVWQLFVDPSNDSLRLFDRVDSNDLDYQFYPNMQFEGEDGKLRSPVVVHSRPAGAFAGKRGVLVGDYTGIFYVLATYADVTSSRRLYFRLNSDPGDAAYDSDTIPASGAEQAIAWNVEFPWMDLSTQRLEAKERLRRVNLLGIGGFNADIFVDGEDDTPAWSSGDVAFSSGNDEAVLHRLRPEVRGSRFKLSLSSDGNVGQFQLHELEFIYRGGKEH